MKELLNLLGKLVKVNLFSDLSYPFKVNFSLTNRCKYSCKTCNIWKTEKDEMDLAEIKKVFEDTGFLSWVSLTGGEPFLRDDILEIARTISENNPIYVMNIPTSGFNPSEIKRKVEELLEVDVEYLIVSISLDGLKEVHDKIKGRSGAFESSVETFNELKKLKSDHNSLNAFYEYQISPYNMDEQVSKLINKLGIQPSDLHFTIFHKSKHYYHNIEMKKPEDFEEKVEERIKEILDLRGSYYHPKDFLPELYLKNFNHKKNFCGALLSSFFLDCNGDVYPCVNFNRKIGNVKNESLKNILNSKKSKELRSKTKKRECPECWSPCSAYQTILSNLLSFI